MTMLIVIHNTPSYIYGDDTDRENGDGTDNKVSVLV